MSEPPATSQPPADIADLRDGASRALKKAIHWSVWIGATCIAAVFLLGATLAILYENWILEIARDHFAATIGLPLAALASFAIVTILESSSGPLEFEGLGFKFKGAAGPAVMWLMCFMAIATAIKALW